MEQEQRNLGLLRHLYTEYQKGLLEPLFAMLADDAVWCSGGPSEVPWSGRFEGPAGVRRYFEILAQEVEVRRYETREFIAQGDRVVVLAGIEIMHKRANRVESYDKIDVFKMRDGRLVEFHEYYDTAKAVVACREPECQGAP